MKFLKKQWVAVTVMVVAILLASGIGILKGGDSSSVGGTPEPDVQGGQYGLDSLPIGGYEQWIVDKADVLASGTEELLSLYNARKVPLRRPESRSHQAADSTSF